MGYQNGHNCDSCGGFDWSIKALSWPTQVRFAASTQFKPNMIVPCLVADKGTSPVSGFRSEKTPSQATFDSDKSRVFHWCQPFLILHLPMEATSYVEDYPSFDRCRNSKTKPPNRRTTDTPLQGSDFEAIAERRIASGAASSRRRSATESLKFLESEIAPRVPKW
ncbi:MAG TPA: hypothetical protein DDZ51_02060 [Planctomycetaceae bacterium]|nr:hypothetical protein [Planctomycetaceae bacterium]